MEAFWRWQLERARAGWARRTLSPTAMVIPLAALGERDRAVDVALRACHERHGGYLLPLAAVDPRWDPLRDHPRFAEVLACIGVAAEKAAPRQG
jgi:hypothetical protein